MSDVNTTETNTGTDAGTTPPTATTPTPPAAPKTVTMADVVKAELAMAEKLVVLKYPNLKIVPGSMVQEANHPTYGNKRRVQVTCNCGCVVERATSDLHTFIGCEACKKTIRKQNKLAKKVNMLQALAAAQAGSGSDAEGEDEAGE